LLSGDVVCKCIFYKFSLYSVIAVTKCSTQHASRLSEVRQVMCQHLDEQTFTSLIPALDYFTFQQDGAPAHRAREAVELLKVETPDFIPPNLWPHNSPDLNPVDYKIWGLLQERVYKTSIKDVDELRRRIAEEWDKLDQSITLIKQLQSGERDFERVLLQAEDSLDTKCEIYHL